MSNSDKQAIGGPLKEAQNANEPVVKEKIKLPEIGAVVTALSALSMTRSELYERCRKCSDDDPKAFGYALGIQQLTDKIEETKKFLHELQEATPKRLKELEEEVRSCSN